MSHGLFDVFSKMIADLPARAIPTAIELQCKMLDEDEENDRLASAEDARSIRCFRQFVQAANSSRSIERMKALLPDHVEFYKETIVRMVQAAVLPPSAMEQFDRIFVRPGQA